MVDLTHFKRKISQLGDLLDTTTPGGEHRAALSDGLRELENLYYEQPPSTHDQYVLYEEKMRVLQTHAANMIRAENNPESLKFAFAYMLEHL